MNGEYRREPHLFNHVESSPTSRQISWIINESAVLDPQLVSRRCPPKPEREESEVSVGHVVVLSAEQKPSVDRGARVAVYDHCGRRNFARKRHHKIGTYVDYKANRIDIQLFDNRVTSGRLLTRVVIYDQKPFTISVYQQYYVDCNINQSFTLSHCLSSLHFTAFRNVNMVRSRSSFMAREHFTINLVRSRDLHFD